MSVIDRSALEESPLADLHAIASELSIDGYRRLRRPDLIDAIMARQGGEGGAPEGFGGGDGDHAPAATEPDDLADVVAQELPAHDVEQAPARRRRGRRGGRGRAREEEGIREDTRGHEGEEVAGEEASEEAEHEDERGAAEDIVEGVVELLPNGSGFVRVNPPEPSDEDVYISAAQVKRCELISGDRVSGPRRAPRRSERFASLVRIDAINGRPASEVADIAPFDELPAAFPRERFRMGSEDPTVKAIEWLTPFGRGSRVSIVGQAQAGKTEALRRLAAPLIDQNEIQPLLVLAGVRPEEISEWAGGAIEPAAAVSFAASADAQGQAVERVLDQARRLAARGSHAVVLLDTLDGLHPHAARKALAAARNIVDGGSVTVIATGSEPIGGETTVIALDGSLTATGRFPALDLSRSWTMRAELLVGEAGAEVIARTRSEALEG
jgi:transcription termination factor Rho